MLISNGKALPETLFSETTPILSNGYFYASSGLNLTRSHQTYGALYRSQPWIATLINKVASAATRVPFEVIDIKGEIGKQDASETPYGRLISQPSLTIDPFTFYRWGYSTHEIYGESFFIKIRKDGFGGSGEVMNLIPMHPTRTVVNRNEQGEVEYVFTLGVASAGILRVAASDVIPWLSYNPDTQLRGLSRMESLRSTLINEDSSRRAQASFWDQGARPSMLLKSKTLSAEGQAKLQKQFAALNSGADNAGRVAVLEDGMEAQIIQLNMEEMQYIEGRKLNRDEICAVYDIPPAAVHILERATFSNITEGLRSVYRDSMMPRMIDLESVVDFHLRPDFKNANDLRAQYDLTDVLRGDFEAQADSVAKLVNAAVYTPAEGRKKFNLIYKGELSDRLFGNAALVELGESSKQSARIDPVTGKPIAGDFNASPATFGGSKSADVTVRSIAGMLGREKNINDMKRACDNFLASGVDQSIVTEAFNRVSKNLKE